MNLTRLFKLSPFAAVACLGLGIFAAGCGESGSTTPSPLGIVYSATYEYSSAPAARVLLDANITGVQYDFFNTANQLVSDSEVLPIKHLDAVDDLNVTVRNLKEDTASSVAYYFNDKEEIVALGIDALHFDETTGTALVTAPFVETKYAGHVTGVAASATPVNIDIGETSQVAVSATYTVGEKKLPLDLTKGAHFEVDKTEVLNQESGHRGLFKGIDYGKATVSITPALKMGADFVNPTIIINVTDAKLTGVDIRYNDNDNTAVNFLLPNWNCALGKVVFAETEDYFTDSSSVEMYLVELYTTETAGAEGYEKVVKDNLTWSLEGVSDTAPEFAAEPSDDGRCVISALKAGTATVNAKHTAADGSSYSDQLKLAAFAAQFSFSTTVDIKLIDGKEYPTMVGEVLQGEETPWILSIFGCYYVPTLDKESNEVNIAKKVESIIFFRTNLEAGHTEVSLKLNDEATAYELMLPEYIKEDQPTDYVIHFFIKLNKMLDLQLLELTALHK